MAIGITLVLEPLDSEPFYHGYGPRCKEKKVTVATWHLPVIDLLGHKATIQFHIVREDDPLLLGNNIMSVSTLVGAENSLLIPENVIAPVNISLPTYTTGKPNCLRTMLHVVQAQSAQLQTLLSSSNSASIAHSPVGRSQVSSQKRQAEAAMVLAVRIHTFTHLTAKDMKEICNRAGVLNPTLSQALDLVVHKCTSCKRSGRPIHARKVSFTRVLSDFNEHLQVDFLFIRELQNLPILNMVDVETGISATSLMSSRDMEDASRMIKTKWFDVNGPPGMLSGDLELDNPVIRGLCTAAQVKYAARPARRHNKIGSVESANATFKLFVQHLLMDDEHHSTVRETRRLFYEILSCATFLKNVLYGGKEASSFELARGFTPSLCGLRQSPLSKQALRSHQEQVARRALEKLISSHPVHPLKTSVLPRGTSVYFYEKSAKSASWVRGFVLHAKPLVVRVCTRADLSGRSYQVAYEDVRLVPSSSLLFELDKFELGCRDVQPSEASDGETADDFNAADDLNIASDQTTSPIVPPTELPLGEVEPLSQERAASVWGEESLALNDLGAIDPPLDPLLDEAALWVRHAERSSMLGSSVSPSKRLQLPAMDINVPTSTEMLLKDIGETRLAGAKDFNVTLSSLNQEELTRIRDLLGDSPVTESKLQFAPRWLLDESIAKEKVNYVERGAYQPVFIRDVPRNSNIISSHHFFQVKRDGEASKLKLKCRLVPHGNRDAEKQSLRSDSSTAQFPCIRVLLSLSVLFHFELASLDMAAAYLQAGMLEREIYMRPPRGWTKYIDEVWKLLNPAYGLVESGRLWQLCIEELMTVYGFETIPGLPQLFILRQASQRTTVTLIAAKVVDG